MPKNGIQGCYLNAGKFALVPQSCIAPAECTHTSYATLSPLFCSVKTAVYMKAYNHSNRLNVLEALHFLYLSKETAYECLLDYCITFARPSQGSLQLIDSSSTGFTRFQAYLGSSFLGSLS